jgi:SAM-dependent methyltransferase
MHAEAELPKSPSREVTEPSLRISDYARERLFPKAGQILYLPMSDLLLAVKTIVTDEQIRILDYGANDPPYRTLFPNSDYRCADIGGPGAKDYLIGADGKVKEQDEVFDLVLSTQVAEHLPDPPVYFAECFRLLKPGGRLFLSTHGSFGDHAFPGDYQRWTAEGLKRDLKKVGFEIETGYKMTTGPRAAIYNLESCFETTFVSRKTAVGMTLWLMRSAYRTLRPLIHRMADRYLDNYRVVSVDGSPEDQAHVNYIIVAVTARRPDSMR